MTRKIIDNADGSYFCLACDTHLNAPHDRCKCNPMLVTETDLERFRRLVLPFLRGLEKKP